MKHEMRFTCPDRASLAAAVSFAATVAPAKTAKPVLQHVRLSTGLQVLHVRATDLDVAVSIDLPLAEIDTPGCALLPAREAAALLREMGGDTVELHSVKHRCTITGDGGSYMLVGEDPDTFPDVEPVEADPIEIPAEQLAGMIRRTVFAAAREDSRYSLGGVMLDASASATTGTLNLVATDGRRLSICTAVEVGGTVQARAIVPVRALQLVARAIGEWGEGACQIRIGENRASFTFGQVTISAQLLECSFPDYAGVIPKTSETKAVVSREAWEHATKKVAVMAGRDLRSIECAFSAEGLVLMSSNSEVGTGTQNMEAEVDGPDVTLRFNPDYLVDGLKASDAETVTVHMGDDSTPAKLEMGDGCQYVLMPISGS